MEGYGYVYPVSRSIECKRRKMIRRQGFYAKYHNAECGGSSTEEVETGWLCYGCGVIIPFALSHEIVEIFYYPEDVERAHLRRKGNQI